MSLARRVLPRSLVDALVARRVRRRMAREDERLRALSISLSADHVRGATVLPDTRALLDLLPKGGVVAEVGVAEGDFSAAILATCAPTTLHLIDLWGSTVPRFGAAGLERVQARFADRLADGRVRIHRGLSWERIAALPDASLDWVYVDAGHDYDSVRRDLSAVVPKLRPDGWIAGDDYVMWAGPDGRYGVVEAVNELCLTQGFRLVHLVLQRHMHLKYALRRGPAPS